MTSGTMTIRRRVAYLLAMGLSIAVTSPGWCGNNAAELGCQLLGVAPQRVRDLFYLYRTQPGDSTCSVRVTPVPYQDFEVHPILACTSTPPYECSVDLETGTATFVPETCFPAGYIGVMSDTLGVEVAGREGCFAVSFITASGSAWFVGSMCFRCDSLLVGVQEAPSKGLHLGSPRPSPTLNGVSVDFELPAAGRALLQVHDVAGRLVRTLEDGWFDAGRHSVRWSGLTATGGRLPAGVYWLRLTVAGETRSRPVPVMR
jgi:hypothetical protein